MFLNLVFPMEVIAMGLAAVALGLLWLHFESSHLGGKHHR